MEHLGKHGARVKRLRQAVRRRPQGVVLVDGVRLVADLVRWQLPILELYVTPENLASAEIAEAVDAAREVLQVEPELLASLAPTRSPQGVLAVTEEPSWPVWRGERGIALWLDAVQDPGNLGAIVRAAAGLGAAAVLLGPGCADPFGAIAVRGAAGAVLRIPVEREVTATRAVERVRSAGGSVWATGAAGIPVTSWRPEAPTLVLLGAEGRGLDRHAAVLADGAVVIPLARDVESLNVAVAAGILLHCLRR